MVISTSVMHRGIIRTSRFGNFSCPVYKNTIIYEHLLKLNNNNSGLRVFCFAGCSVPKNSPIIHENSLYKSKQNNKLVCTCCNLSWWHPTKLKASSRKEYLSVASMPVYSSIHWHHKPCHVTGCGSNTLDFLPWKVNTEITHLISYTQINT